MDGAEKYAVFEYDIERDRVKTPALGITADCHFDLRTTGYQVNKRYAVVAVDPMQEDRNIPDNCRYSPYALTPTLTLNNAPEITRCEFREDGFYLNGVRRRLRGVNRHQDAGLSGWAAKREDEERDFELIAEVGADAVRLAHYPQSQHVYDICDEKGILVWSEVPATNWLTDSPGFRSNLVAQAREMVAQLRNHPCVFAWSVFNEIYNDVPPERALTCQRAAWL